MVMLYIFYIIFFDSAAFFALTNHLPVIIFPSDKDSNLHLLMAETEEGENFRERLFTNPKFINIMKELYPFFYNRGLFNFDDYKENRELA